MPENTLDVWNEVWWVGAGAVVLLLFSVLIAIKHRP